MNVLSKHKGKNNIYYMHLKRLDMKKISRNHFKRREVKLDRDVDPPKGFRLQRSNLSISLRVPLLTFGSINELFVFFFPDSFEFFSVNHFPTLSKAKVKSEIEEK